MVQLLDKWKMTNGAGLTSDSVLVTTIIIIIIHFQLLFCSLWLVALSRFLKSHNGLFYGIYYSYLLFLFTRAFLH